MFSKYFTIVLTFTATSIIRDSTVQTQDEDYIHGQLRIFNGDPATVGQIPYFVSIKEPVKRFTGDMILWKNLCGGSIISVDKVLTAAHCFEVYEYQYLYNPQNLRVVAGSVRNSVVYSGINLTEVDNQWRGVRRITVHDGFQFPNNDIALVLVNDWVYSDYISYVVPASVTMDYGTRCQVVGFGMISHGLSEAPSPVLLVTKIYVMGRWKCNILWNHVMDDFVCSDSSETDVTRGDSGGPLVCRHTNDPAEESGRDLLVGIVSGKSSGKSTLYTRVSAYNQWLGRSFACKFLVNEPMYLIILALLLYFVYSI